MERDRPMRGRSAGVPAAAVQLVPWTVLTAFPPKPEPARSEALSPREGNGGAADRGEPLTLEGFLRAALPTGGSDATGPVVLASTSPRRRDLLAGAGLGPDRVIVLDPGLDDAELVPGDVAPNIMAMSLAYLKARAARSRAMSLGVGLANALYLAADTIVVKRLPNRGDRQLGKPADEADARAMLSLLAAGSHRVVTGVALLKGDLRAMFTDSATVCVGPLDDELIGGYVASGQWRGKAGGYNLAERVAAGWPIAASGDPATVMGLPIVALSPLIARLRADAPTAG